MQNLEERNTCTPTDVPQVRGNCGLSLNREETRRWAGLKTSSNNSDAALTGQRRTRTGLASSCYKSPPLLTKNTIADSLILHLLMQGARFLTNLSVEISSTP
jgi:hypothetical protein